MDKNYRNLINDSIKLDFGDYKEIRLEENISSRITYNGKERENISINSRLGGSVRAMANGGWGFSSFNDIYQAPLKMKETINLAKYNSNETFAIEKGNPIETTVKPILKKDPRKINLDEKINYTLYLFSFCSQL